MGSSSRFLDRCHAEQIRRELNSKEGLPVSEVLPAEAVANAMQGIVYRERFFSPADYAVGLPFSSSQ